MHTNKAELMEDVASCGRYGLYGSRVRVDWLSVAELMEDVYHHSSCTYIIDTEFCRSKRMGQTVFAESRF